MLRASKKTTFFVLLTFFISLQTNVARAWLPEKFEDDFGTKTFVLSTFFDLDERVQYPFSQPESNRYAAIGIRCQDSAMSVAFQFSKDGSPVKLWKKKSIDIRFDGGKTLAWPVTVGPSNFGWLGNEGRFVGQLKKARIVSIRATDSRGSFVTANFNVENSKDFTREFREYGCRW